MTGWSRAGQPPARGRVIGDGGWYFHIADMATLPEHQGRGLGHRLYESMGFVETAPESLGMRRAP